MGTAVADRDDLVVLFHEDDEEDEGSDFEFEPWATDSSLVETVFSQVTDEPSQPRSSSAHASGTFPAKAEVHAQDTAHKSSGESAKVSANHTLGTTDDEWTTELVVLWVLLSLVVVVVVVASYWSMKGLQPELRPANSTT